MGEGLKLCCYDFLGLLLCAAFVAVVVLLDATLSLSSTILLAIIVILVLLICIFQLFHVRYVKRTQAASEVGEPPSSLAAFVAELNSRRTHSPQIILLGQSYHVDNVYERDHRNVVVERYTKKSVTKVERLVVAPASWRCTTPEFTAEGIKSQAHGKERLRTRIRVEFKLDERSRRFIRDKREELGVRLRPFDSKFELIEKQVLDDMEVGVLGDTSDECVYFIDLSSREARGGIACDSQFCLSFFSLLNCTYGFFFNRNKSIAKIDQVIEFELSRCIEGVGTVARARTRRTTSRGNFGAAAAAAAAVAGDSGQSRPTRRDLFKQQRQESFRHRRHSSRSSSSSSGRPSRATSLWDAAAAAAAVAGAAPDPAAAAATAAYVRRHPSFRPATIDAVAKELLLAPPRSALLSPAPNQTYYVSFCNDLHKCEHRIVYLEVLKSSTRLVAALVKDVDTMTMLGAKQLYASLDDMLLRLLNTKALVYNI